ncbi:MAG: FAD-binding protein [Paenibacillaceae bacterium]|jgi:succinate dehydrogenase/fumarate reductase flavoprotein subunit|nr:FAD-binding protein [Paenibacillaceae bacterium]
MIRNHVEIGGIRMDVYSLNTVIVGSGAAGLNAADSLHQLGQQDIALLTEGINMGTSRNTGSDKQTYYKLGLEGSVPDSVMRLAETLFAGGGMHGDIALIEAALSPKCFYKLAEIGVPFPHNRYGEYIGYKTDHDPGKRATSAGPLTSRFMTEQLERQVKNKGIAIFDGYRVIAVLTDRSPQGEAQAIGLLTLHWDTLNEENMGFTLFNCTNIVYATGGPAGMYQQSVYPESQTGATGAALEAGARGVNLTESQYGIASTDFRWNLSGTYQQVLPRYVSTNPDGSGEREFLDDCFDTPGQMADAIFLKGYQWPFDPRKVHHHGSSLIDILVYTETQLKGRKVYLDFTRNPSWLCSGTAAPGETGGGSEAAEENGGRGTAPGVGNRMGNTGISGVDFSLLGHEAYEYLRQSDALFGTPIERLAKMNQPAIDLYQRNGIDLSREYLRIDVCAQHNNGGLAGNIWWESNLRHFFPVGEACGTLGIYRPGGSALNATQVGSYRAAQYIQAQYRQEPPAAEVFAAKVSGQVEKKLKLAQHLVDGISAAESSIWSARDTMRANMTRNGAFIRSAQGCTEGLEFCRRQLANFADSTRIANRRELPEAFINLDILLTQLVYLSAIEEHIGAGGGSRGSYLIHAENGEIPHPKLASLFRFQLEEGNLAGQVCEMELVHEAGEFRCGAQWKPVRPIPDHDNWFENVWNAYTRNQIIV